MDITAKMQTEKAKKIRIARLVRKNPDIKRIHSENEALKLRVAELEQKLAEIQVTTSKPSSKKTK